jgi:hypothetical protein
MRIFFIVNRKLMKLVQNTSTEDVYLIARKLVLAEWCSFGQLLYTDRVHITGDMVPGLALK